tara:strand:- start:1381 stop:1680 length:300 start_codon:yes stop_codon:yes gene_type:complete
MSMRKLREEIEETQKQELARLKESTSTVSDDNLMGWIEALEYVKGQIDAVSNTGEPIVTIPISEYDIELFEQLVRAGGSFSWKFDGVDVTFVKQEGEEE